MAGSGLEKIIAFDIQMQFEGFMNSINIIKKKTKELTNSFIASMKQIQQAVIPKDVHFNQAMDGYKKQYEALADSLKPLGEEVKASFDKIIVPTKTAEQTVEEFLNTNKKTAKFSQEMKQMYADMDKEQKRFIKNTQKSSAMMQGNAQQMINQVSSVQKMADGFDSFAGVMSMTQEQFKKVNIGGAEFNSLGGRLGNKIRTMTQGMRGFKMELLGVMFFGMMVQKTFTGMLRPAAELVGVFEIWSTILEVTFLPIILELLPYLLDFMDFMLNLSPETQKAIGVFALIGAAFGTLLYYVGAIGLGIGSLIQAFGGMAAVTEIVETVLAIFGGLSASVAIVIGVIIAIIAGMVMAWKENFANMKDWTSVFIESIKEYFEGLKEFFKGILDIIVGIFTGDFEKIKEGVIEIFVGLWKIVKSLIKMAFAFIVMAGIGVFKIIANVFSILWEAIKWVFSKIYDGAKWLWDKLSELFPDMTAWIEDVVAGIKDAINWLLKLLRLRGKDGGSSGGDNGGSGDQGSASDFIWRPGKGPLKINPNDTLVGYKNAGKGAGMGMGSNVTINQTINATTSNKDEMDRLIRDNNRKMVDDLKRIVKVPVSS